MAEKKYLDLVGLGQYDAKIKALIDSKDAAKLAEAKAYADGLAVNYDAAGAAATAESNAKGYTDGKVTELNQTIAGVKTIAEQGVSDAAAAKSAADAAQADVDALETLVGVLPESATAETVVAYVDEKTSGIASEGAMTALEARVTAAEGDIDAIQADYLKAADKTELEGKITTAQDAADAAQDAADAVQAEMDAFKLAADVQEGAVDTLKEIQDYITSDGEAAQLMVADIAANAKAIEDEVAAREQAISDLDTAYKAADSAQVARIEALEAKFDGDDSVADQIAAAVAAEAELREEADAALDGKIAQNKTDIQSAQNAADLAQEEVDALEIVVDTKAAQADLDALAGRVTTAEGEIDDLQAASHEHENKAVLDGITAALISNWNDAAAKAHEHANKDVLDGITAQLVSNWNAAEGNAKAYTDEKIAEFVAITTAEVDGLFA